MPHSLSFCRARPLFSRSVTALSLGFALGATTSIGIISERLTAGSAHVSTLFALATVPLGALFIAHTRAVHRTKPIALQNPITPFVLQLLGLILAVVTLHASLWETHATSLFGLREAPRQLVNDLILGPALLLVAWSFIANRRRHRLFFSLTSFALIASYCLTARLWHLDAVPFTPLTVQQYVPEQFTLAAAGLLALYLLGLLEDPSIPPND